MGGDEQLQKWLCGSGCCLLVMIILIATSFDCVEPT